MQKSKYPGLYKRGDAWHIDKQVDGTRIRQSLGTDNEREAIKLYVHLLEQHRQKSVYGERPEHIFKDAALKYVNENKNKSSIKDDIRHLKDLYPYIGELSIKKVHLGTLEPFIQHRLKEGKKPKTINNALSVVRAILNRASRQWRDEHGNLWLESAPLINLLNVSNTQAQPYPLSLDEQRRLFQLLPDYLAAMALFKVNTGTREQEVCQLKWDYEVKVPEFKTSVFILPGQFVKNREDRLIVLNKTAYSIVNQCRGLHPEYVFTYKGRRVKKMHTTSWKNSWKKAGLPTSGEYMKGVHNLKHTCGRRLRAVGVSLEIRRVLLGHTNGDITTHYSGSELLELINASEKLNEYKSSSPTIYAIKRATGN